MAGSQDQPGPPDAPAPPDAARAAPGHAGESHLDTARGRHCVAAPPAAAQPPAERAAAPSTPAAPDAAPSAAVALDASAPAACADLPGWASDDLAAALAAYGRTAALADLPLPPTDAGPDWLARAFTPGPATRAFFTGYYEPELPGAATRSDAFPVPLLALPPGLPPGPSAPDRSAIVAGLFDAHALCWLADPLEAFLAQVQGSVRVRLRDGQVLRLGYAGKNGHPYRSIGQELVARGAVAAEAIDIQAIRDWAAAHPADLEGLLSVNPSYVFFRSLDLPPEAGPLGAMGASVTPLRSIAVDPAHVRLGSPVWVEAPGLPARLVIAQDIGGAIKGAGRGDLYIGSGPEAGRIAGALRTPGRLWVLHPRGQG